MISTFRDFVYFTEGSFTEEDVPKFFYVGIYFSEDLVKPKSYTPKGAVCTLVGVEGVSSSNLGIWHGASLKMPGQAVVRLNKISKHMYDNPNYLASRGFRGPRRTQSGSGGQITNEKGVSGRGSYNEVNKSRIESLLYSIKMEYPDMFVGNSLKLTDGNEMDYHDFFKTLQTIKPHRGVFSKSGRVKEQEPIRKDRVKQGRPQPENQLKTLRSATDLASRVYLIFRGLRGNPGVKNPERLLEPSNDDYKSGRKKPQIVKFVERSSLGAGWHAGEREWIMHRNMIPKSKVQKCPACYAWNPVSEGDKEINCRNCNTKFTVDERKTNDARPMLHVPEGSFLFIGTGAVPEWAQAYINKVRPNWPASPEEKIKFIVNEFKLYQRFTVHLVKNGGQASDLADKTDTKKPHDPERLIIGNKIRKAIDKGIDYIPMLQKFLEKKEGILPSKVSSFLSSWQKIGMVEINDDRVKLINSSMDEFAHIVYKYILNHEDLSKLDIENGTGVDDIDLDKALNDLTGLGKIESHNGKYNIKLTDEEMTIITPLEQRIIDILTNDAQGSYYDITNALNKDKGQPDASVAEVKESLKMLKLKHKIFQGAWSDDWMVAVDDSSPLDAQEKEIIEHLKQWPVSDKQDITSLGEDGQALNRAADCLAYRGLVTITDEVIKLDVDKTKPSEGTKPYPKYAHDILELLAKHFICGKYDLVGLVGKNYYQISDMLKSITGNNWATYDNNWRLIPASNQAVSADETPEGKTVLEYINNKKVIDDTHEVLNLIRKNNTNYDSTTVGRLLGVLAEAGLITKEFNPISDEHVWVAKDHSYEIDTSDEEEKLTEIIGKAGVPLTTSTIRDEDSYELSSQAIDFILNRMVKAGSLKKGEDVAGFDVWYLPHQAGPKTLQEYMNDLKLCCRKQE